MLSGYRRAVVVVTCVGRLDSRVRLRRKRTNYIRERVVRQPARAVIVGLARPHPVTGTGRVTILAVGVGGLARVIPRCKKGASRADREVRLPLGTSTAVGVQHERRAKGYTTVGGADIEDVAGVAASAVLCIDQVNKIVDRGRLTPALVPPVAAVSAKYPGEVT